LHILHFVDAEDVGQTKTFPVELRDERWSVWVGADANPYFFSGGNRHIVLHHWEKNIRWSGDCI
jgi:hypothetical protein